MESASESKEKIIDILRQVYDPEIPVLSVVDMGVVRDVEITINHVHVKITPTYSGCPAMDTMADDIIEALKVAGYTADAELILSPPWTTDWITNEGRENLQKYGIAPPLEESLDKKALLDGKKIVPCPRCKSTKTKMISQFGSTACKSLFQCIDCLEPFDYLKCLK